jgi:NAD(P)-dependent dehydrogenase (short-subunit alcohol dehydrogenase family)
VRRCVFRSFKDIAAVVLYLASDDSRFTAAIDLVVDGGMSQV